MGKTSVLDQALKEAREAVAQNKKAADDLRRAQKDLREELARKRKAKR